VLSLRDRAKGCGVHQMSERLESSLKRATAGMKRRTNVMAA